MEVARGCPLEATMGFVTGLWVVTLRLSLCSAAISCKTKEGEGAIGFIAAPHEPVPASTSHGTGSRPLALSSSHRSSSYPCGPSPSLAPPTARAADRWRSAAATDLLLTLAA